MMEKIAILGSTGSIGVNALEVVSSLKDRFEVVALSADSNAELLSKQSRAFLPKVIAIRDDKLAKKLKRTVPSGTRIVCGMDGLAEIASRSDVDVVLFALSGAVCLIPLIEAIRHRKRIALANKESLVCAGSIIKSEARRHNVRIVPIDSEHSAIFQCIEGRERFLAKIYLTGSGGPLLDVPVKKFDKLPREFILRHPRWKMGKKISVDSATMMNKGLEIIEAKHLFDINEKEIEVLIHPEAIIHSMVELTDGAILAQMGAPDMRSPIQYALTYPNRLKSLARNVDFSRIAALTFRQPDVKKFPCLSIARQAARDGGSAPAALCAADEELVGAYLGKKIRFSDIPKNIEKVLSRHKNIDREPSIYDVLEADRWAREEARSLCCH
ncbi:MAG: 1-deoxy-D-xylulose-5-phosphate reductoisomerase [Candidatus Omnitrophota bacterium]|nr:1-deoxy-D-xylulose-5-phosphate reductoisomerase [Candidatus Omnitrophota bacterium]